MPATPEPRPGRAGPRVTVAIRCYRQAEYLPEAVASVLAQPYRDVEIVVVDDGSPDDAAPLTRALAAAHPDRAIRLVSQENQGLCGALNAGARAARGELLLFLDADDQLLEGALGALVSALDAAPDASIAYGDVVLFGGRAGLLPAGDFELAALRTGNRLPYCSLYRRALWERAGGYRENMALGYEDWDFWLSCAEAGARAVRLPGPVLRYRVKAGSAVTAAQRHHALLCARLVLNHPALHAAEAVAQARDEVERGAARLEAEARAAGDAAALRSARALRLHAGAAPASAAPAGAPAAAPPAAAEPEYLVTAIVSAFKATRFLRGCLQDLVDQTLYRQGRLEILVVDTGSPEDEGAIVREFQARHPHIRYLRTEDRRTLYAAWNLGVEAARGRYLTNANADDRHREDALERLAEALERRPDVALVYADQIYSPVPNDTLAATRSRRRRVWAEFSYATLRSHCMVGCQPMWRRALHARYGPFDAALASAGDWDFWLRVGRHERFLKLDEVLGLYYENPTGLENSHPASVAEAELVRRRHGIGPAERAGSGFAEWAGPAAPPAAAPRPPSPAQEPTMTAAASPSPLSIVVAAQGPWAETFRCLMALARSRPARPTEIVVVDCGTRDETRLALPRLEGVRAVRLNSDQGLARALNAGAGAATGRILAFVRGDAEPRPGWLEPLLSVLDGHPEVAVAGAVLSSPDGRVTCNGFALAYAQPWPLTPMSLPEQGDEPLEVPGVSAAAMAVQADAFRELGGFDEGYWNGWEDLDLCLRARAAGRKVVVCPESRVVAAPAEPSADGRNESLLNDRWLGRVPLLDVEAARSPSARRPRAGRPPLTLVVPTHDALRSIARCVDEATRELGEADELLLADAGSRDGTARFLSLLAAERPGRVHLVPARPADGAAGAVRAGLLEATRDVAVLLPARASMPAGFLDELTRLLDGHQEAGAVALPLPGAGLCVAGHAPLLAEVAAASPDAFLREDPTALGQALQARGARLLFVAPGGVA